MAEPTVRGRLRRILVGPVPLVLVVAPFCGEGLSGSTPPAELLLPWNLAFMAALYGCGALVCREVAHRFRLGFPGLVLLGAAYAVWEEALVDRYWFFPTFWRESGVGTYSVVGHTNVLLAAHLTVFHTAVSVCSSVLVVEWLVPRARQRPWASRPGLAAAGLVLALTPLIYGELDQRPPTPVLVGAAVLLVALVGSAFLVGRRHRSRTAAAPRPPRRGLGLVAFGAILAHWCVTYTVAGTGLVWPVGVALALLPVVAGGGLVVRMATTSPYGRDGVRVVVGLLGFFVLLDLLLALLGRYDMLLNAAAAAGLAWWLSARPAQVVGPEPVDERPPS